MTLTKATFNDGYEQLLLSPCLRLHQEMGASLGPARGQLA